ncbi:tRNA-dihydrouridine synthase family protein [Candidatus Saccharibacteria bacterium]|nr:tRNA-dihydrouridine synthase family protein [Candidatus Saccharibacteria bacterium]
MKIWQDLPQHFLALAPMEGVTDVVFRQVIAHAGKPDLFFTEFTNVSSFANEKGRENALERLDTVASDHPIIAQIWGKTPEHFATLAQNLEDLHFQGLDINMGCPDRHVIKAGGGSAMIQNPTLAVECIKQAKANTNLPVSIKTRLGYSKISEYQTWLPLLLEQNLANLTVHLRTRKEMSKVPAHFELIPDIIKLRDNIAPNTKLTINGDIKDKSHAEKIWAKYPEVDGIMIGRGVFTNPYCFTNHTPSQEELLNLFKYHLDLFEARQNELSARGSHYPFAPIKHFIKIYINGNKNSKIFRSQLMNCNNIAEIRTFLLSQTDKS